MASDETQQTGASVSQLVSVLVPNAIIAAVFFLIFVALRKRQKRVYEPRHVVKSLPNELRPDDTPSGILGWLTHILGKPQSFLVQHAGPDGYFYLRYLFEFAIVSILGCIITWPILFPVNASNRNSDVEGLDILAFGAVKNKWRYFAHIFVSWVFFGAVIFLIYRELVYYTTFKHALQTTPFYDSLLSSRVLLLTEIPSKLLEEAELREYFPTATNIWYGRDYTELQKKVKERTKLAKKYEGALNGVLTKAVKLRAKALKKGKPAPEPADDLNKYLKDGKKRPTHKLKFLIGKKVDTLDYGAEHLGELNKDIKKSQLEHNSNTQLPAVFIEFPTQLELQKAYQAVPYNKELKKTRRYSQLSPDDVIWENLTLTPAKRYIKAFLANTVLTLTIIFWGIPVAVVGAISNIDTITKVAPFLEFINNMPKKLMGIITGLLPVVALAILMSLVPPFIRFMAKVSGRITHQDVERYTQNWYFAFQVVHTFLVVTLCSAAASSVPDIVKSPDTLMPLLATKLPKASNFYISYMCYVGLTVAAKTLAQLVPLILAQVLGKILDKTPRAKWTRATTIGQPSYAILYSTFQVVTVIAFSYAIIAPLILGFTAITFIFILFAYLYTFVYVQIPNRMDGRGRNYVTTLFELFTGLYLAEIVLTALFVFTKNWACVALEGVAILGTAIAHVYFKRKFLTVIDIVPISAIKHAAGDSTFQYPMHDQGYSEIKTEGENYWQGGNQLGLTGEHDQVLPQKDVSVLEEGGVFDNGTHTIVDSDDSKHDTEPSAKLTEKNNEKAVVPPAANKTFDKSQLKPTSLVSIFFKPKLLGFDEVRASMPDSYYNYVEYNPEFLKTAYDDPAVNDDEPHIWIARDEMGLSEIEKNKALEHGVDVSDENTSFDEKNTIVYNGPPPAYEEPLRI